MSENNPTHNSDRKRTEPWHLATNIRAVREGREPAYLALCGEVIPPAKSVLKGTAGDTKPRSQCPDCEAMRALDWAVEDRYVLTDKGRAYLDS